MSNPTREPEDRFQLGLPAPPLVPAARRPADPEAEERPEVLAWLAARKDEQLVAWLVDFLVGVEVEPFDYDPSRPPYQRLAKFLLTAEATDPLPEVLASIRDATARALLARTVSELVTPVGAELMLLAGGLRVVECQPRLLALAKSGVLKGKLVGGVDLHSHLLGVLFGMSNEPDVLVVCRRDIADPLYTARCFRKFWELDFHQGLNYLPDVLALHDKARTNVEAALLRFAEAVGERSFHAMIPEMLNTLSDLHFSTLRAALSRQGIYLLVHRPHGLPAIQLVWTRDNKSAHTPLPDVTFSGRPQALENPQVAESAHSVQRDWMKSHHMKKREVLAAA